MPGPETAVYLADTLGEMAFWYPMAGITMIGGTLVPKGGHTPFEPAAFGSALIHGPDVANFAEAFAALTNAGGAIEISDAVSLAGALQDMTPERQAALAIAAKAALLASEDPEALISDLKRILPSTPGQRG